MQKTRKVVNTKCQEFHNNKLKKKLRKLLKTYFVNANHDLK